MKEDSFDLAIEWKAIHELTNFTHTSTKEIDNRFVEIFEPRGFDSDIQPRLINWRDLEIPNEWLIKNTTEKQDNKFYKPIEFKASGQNLYFRDTRALGKRPIEIPRISFSQPDTDDDNQQNAIALKNVQIPIFPSTSSKQEDIGSIIFSQVLIGEDEEIIFSVKQNKKKYNYVLARFNFSGYKQYQLDVLIDTGATSSTCRWNALPPEKWVKMKTPILAKGIDGKETKIEYKAKNIPIWLGNKKFLIPKILCFPFMHGDMLLGNNFLQKYYPLKVNHNYIKLALNGEKITIPILEEHKFRCHKDFAPLVKRGEFYTLDQSHWIYKVLEQNFSEDPLKLWSRSPRYCSLKLNDPNKIIGVKPMVYTKQDIDEFSVQIKELLQKGLIEPTTSPHSSPAFMVRNHAEIKRGKARMVINYKRLNQNLEFDGYFIPRKDVLVNQTKHANYFSKFDCKSGFWQLKLTKESKLLTAFSAPYGHYQWTVMPFGLCNAP